MERAEANAVGRAKATVLEHESRHGRSVSLRRWFNRAATSAGLRGGGGANCTLALQRCGFYSKEFTIHGLWVRGRRNRKESRAFAECHGNVALPAWDSSALAFLETVWPDCKRRGTPAFVLSQYCKHAHGFGVFADVGEYVQAAMAAYFQCQAKGWANLVRECEVFSKSSAEIRVPFHCAGGTAQFAADC